MGVCQSTKYPPTTATIAAAAAAAAAAAIVTHWSSGWLAQIYLLIMFDIDPASISPVAVYVQYLLR